MAKLAVGYCASCGTEFAVLPHPVGAPAPAADYIEDAETYAKSPAANSSSRGGGTATLHNVES